MWALSLPHPVPAAAARRRRRLLRSAHPPATSRRSNAPDHIGILVALKDRQNALKNPYAHLHEPDITFDSVKDSMMLWDPIRYSETCPSSDGACAMVLTDEAGGDAAAAEGRQPAWVHGTAMRTEPTMFAGRDQVNPQAGQDVRRRRLRAGRHHQPPRARSTSSRCTCRSAGSSRCGSRTSASPSERQGWKLIEDGVTADGRRPAGQLLGRRALAPTRSAPRACSASPRPPCRCAARPASTRSTAPAPALGHAYGGGSQFFAMWVVGADKP